ncbi:hypothetical protein CERSUDRAFT_122574 [Gelatoporia subvermispora B]|uniref:Uncharacterized protein n=1 Tax=Ceriporiopsis subvermispora (strain B) TaxID=914234 RepID=M2R3L4_CERS8|nr:hypothetical protein CERSUDRAFT_122574 [Gelatoporia subvermispora B]
MPSLDEVRLEGLSLLSCRFSSLTSLVLHRQPAPFFGQLLEIMRASPKLKVWRSNSAPYSTTQWLYIACPQHGDTCRILSSISFPICTIVTLSHRHCEQRPIASLTDACASLKKKTEACVELKLDVKYTFEPTQLAVLSGDGFTAEWEWASEEDPPQAPALAFFAFNTLSFSNLKHLTIDYRDSGVPLDWFSWSDFFCEVDLVSLCINVIEAAGVDIFGGLSPCNFSSGPNEQTHSTLLWCPWLRWIQIDDLNIMRPFWFLEDDQTNLLHEIVNCLELRDEEGSRLESLILIRKTFAPPEKDYVPHLVDRLRQRKLVDTILVQNLDGTGETEDERIDLRGETAVA